MKRNPFLGMDFGTIEKFFASIRKNINCGHFYESEIGSLNQSLDFSVRNCEMMISFLPAAGGVLHAFTLAYRLVRSIDFVGA